MKLTGNFVLSVMALLTMTVGCVRRAPKEADLVLAVVGDKKIRESDFRRELEHLDPSVRSKYRGEQLGSSSKGIEEEIVKNRMALLEKMIEEEVIYQQAFEKNLASTPEARRLLARAEQDAAIARLKEREIYSGVTVAQEEIEKRYREEINRSEGSSIAKSILYISSPPDGDVKNVVNIIERGIEEGLSFPKIAERHSLAYEAIEFDSPRFGELHPQIQSVAVRMGNKTGVAVKLAGTAFYFFKDAEPLPSCFRRVRRVIRDEKGERALRARVSSLRAKSTIHVYETKLEDMSQTDAVAAEVNDVPVTVGDVAKLLETLSEEQKKKLPDKKALLDEAIDREILRQEAWSKNVQNERVVKQTVARETHRILVELLTEQSVPGQTPSAREKNRAEWLKGLKKATGVRTFEENVKKMDIRPSREIEDVFGVQAY